MMKFKVGDRVQRKPEYRSPGSWGCGDSVLEVEYVQEDGGIILQGTLGVWAPRRFELVAPLLARDELYMRLRNDAGLSHADATAFIKECPPHTEIRHALDGGYPTGRIMSRLVVWGTTPQGHKFWSAAAKACPGGWV